MVEDAVGNMDDAQRVRAIAVERKDSMYGYECNHYSVGNARKSFFASLVALLKFTADSEEKLPQIVYWLSCKYRICKLTAGFVPFSDCLNRFILI